MSLRNLPLTASSPFHQPNNHLGIPGSLMRCVSFTRHVVTASRRAYAARTSPPPPAPRAARLRNQPIPIDPQQPLEKTASPPVDESAFAKSRRLPWVLSSIMAGGLGLYVASLIIAANQTCHNPLVAELAQQKDVVGRYDNTAGSFDSEVGLSEVLMMVNSLRKKLARKCTGHVLEVSCGTGRNLGYYDLGKNGDVESLTFVDVSPPMVEVCKKKWDAFFAGSGRDKLRQGLSVRFLAGSALESMPLAPTGQKYDTIIQTMGLCSTPTPTDLLTNMVKHLDMSNPESRILLLEHGRSYMPWMNRILDNAAEKHAELHGCWFNRDIGVLVDEAVQQSGLEVVNERRYHFGTTWMFELRPTAQTVEKLKSPVWVAGDGQATAEQSKDGPKSWFSWPGQK